MRLSLPLLGQLLLGVSGVLGSITLDIDDPDSVKAAAALVADDLLTFYHGDDPGNPIGLFGEPYYWWTSSILWGSLLDLRARTGNTTYDDLILQGLQAQIGSDDDFMPANWTASEGNDDQGFWAQAALLAKETSFLERASNETQWLGLAENVFDEQSNDGRRATEAGNCSGALRWQIYAFNNGYDYVNTASSASYFTIGAQLAHQTKNQTYSDKAAATYDQLINIGLVTDAFNVYDGLEVPVCDSVNKIQSSHNAALLLKGSAYMYNYTTDDIWKTRLDGLLDRTLKLFFPDGVANEVACESRSTCNTDMLFFKGILHRSLAWTAKLAPYTHNTILPALKTSAVAAVSTCTGGDNGRMCGFTWSEGKYDTLSAGAQSSVLGALISVLETTATVEGTSLGNESDASSGTNTGGGNSTDTGGKSNGINVGVSFSALLGGLMVAAFLG